MSDTELSPVKWLRGWRHRCHARWLECALWAQQVEGENHLPQTASNFYACPMACTCSCIKSTFKIQYKNSGFYVLLVFFQYFNDIFQFSSSLIVSLEKWAVDQICLLLSYIIFFTAFKTCIVSLLSEIWLWHRPTWTFCFSALWISTLQISVFCWNILNISQHSFRSTLLLLTYIFNCSLSYGVLVRYTPTV